jgi:acyl phosphate:glycerol-3-phosphate acyltransferase
VSILLLLGLALLGFLLGAVPFSVLVGRRFLKRDIRQVGDGNPGAWNVGLAGGFGWFLVAVTLDVLKGFLPVWLARQPLRIRDLELVVVAIAPVLGHALSPFLGWRGGKALAPTLGVWFALTRWRVPLVAVGVLLVLDRLVRPPGWVVVGGLAAILASLLLWWPDPVSFTFLAASSAVLLVTHRKDLAQQPRRKRGGTGSAAVRATGVETR